MSGAPRNRPALVALLAAWLAKHRSLALALAFLAPSLVVVVSLVVIVRDARRRDAMPSATAASVVRPPAVSVPEPSAGTPPPPLPAPSPLSSLAPADGRLPDFNEATDDGEPTAPKEQAEKKAPPKKYTSVQQAATESCTTASIEGLSKQIIQQARCMKPNAFALLPTRPNLVVAPNVFPYLEIHARNQLVKTLDANPTRRMTLNSALRTVAQQYLVSHWARGRRCGVQLATLPGESNHEIGVALDIAEHGEWRTALEAHEFKWLGATDRVHFDYTGASPPPATATDVLAFQILWNMNHKDDTIATDGRYTPATEQRLKKAPPAGFPIGPRCGKAAASKRP
jgi:hypothetical protein